jgi:hypothetical protein
MPKEANNELKRVLLIRGETLYDTEGRVLASDGDEVEAGLLSAECEAWLLSEGKAEWVEDK